MSPVTEDYLLLLEEVKQGSQAAFDQMYDLVFPLVYGIALKMMKNRQEAEDICQEVLLDFFQRPYLYKPERGSLSAFLAVKTRHKCLDILRKQQREAHVELTETVAATKQHHALEMGYSLNYVNPPVDYVLSKERKEVIQEALQQIPEEQRLALQGAYFEEITQRHLAERMNKPLGTVKSLIRYGLRNMRKQLSRYSGGRAGGGEHG